MPERAATLAALLARGAWLTLALIHLPILLSLLRGLLAGGHADALVGSLALLIAAESLFLAKVADLRVLRIGSGRRTLIATLTLTAYFHHEAVPVDRALNGAAPVVALVATATGAALAFQRRDRVQRLLQRLSDTIASALAQSRLVPPPCGVAESVPLSRWCAAVSVRVCPVRGPPR